MSEELWESFNSAPGWKVALGTLGAVTTAYLATKILTNPKEFKRQFFGTLIKNARNFVPAIGNQVTKEVNKHLSHFEKELDDSVSGFEKFFEIPELGKTKEEVIQLLEGLTQREEHKWKKGKVSGVVYTDDEDHYQVMAQALSLYALSNPLHPDVFPSVRKFESEIISMAVNLLAPGVQGVCGALTSGGTESILLGVKAHRDYYRSQKGITEPEMIVPSSAHAAFLKAAHYFGIKVHVVPVDPVSFDADLKATEKLINGNTIMLVGSAPSYSFGVVDPIAQLGQLAKKNNIGLHVDCCLGGFLLPWFKQLDDVKDKIPNFDFRIDGVTSMSADTHKYGYAVKGTSVVLFRNAEIRRAMYFITTEWPGGVYATATVAGSRPGCLIAACWSSLVHLGKNGFLEKARLISQTQQQIKKGITGIPELKLCGNSNTMIVGFTSSGSMNIFSVMQAMVKKGWSLNALQKPNSLHICVTQRHIGKADEFLTDIKSCISEVLAEPEKFAKDGAAPIYGLAYDMPDRSLIGEIINGYLDVLLDPIQESSSQ